MAKHIGNTGLKKLLNLFNNKFKSIGSTVCHDISTIDSLEIRTWVNIGGPKLSKGCWLVISSFTVQANDGKTTGTVTFRSSIRQNMRTSVFISGFHTYAGTLVDCVRSDSEFQYSIDYWADVNSKLFKLNFGHIIAIKVQDE